MSVSNVNSYAFKPTIPPHLETLFQADVRKATQIMEILEDTETNCPIAKIYGSMSARTQLRGYKMLCRFHGCPSGDAGEDGPSHVVYHPKSLLNRATYHGRTTRIIDHLIGLAGGTPLCVDIAPQLPPSWKTNVEHLGRGKIIQSLDSYLVGKWWRNPDESPRTIEEYEAAETAHRALNQQIFHYVKNQRGIETPMEFVWSLQGNGRSEPRKIGERALQYIPEEGQFYRFDSDAAKAGKPPLKKSDEQNLDVDFGHALKRTSGHLYLFLSGRVHDSISINGMTYPFNGSDARGSNEPSYRFKEGDVVYDYFGKYLFTMGKHGTILYAGNGKHDYPISEESLKQSQRFACSLAQTNENNRDLFTYTAKPRAAEMHEALLPGFSVPSTMKKNENAAIDEALETNYKKRGDLVFIDPPNDPVLKSLIAYLTVEFEVMGYTEAQKMMRIALLSADLLREEVNNSKFKGNNYQLGEIIRAGAGDFRHRAPLVKVLCDAFKLPCCLIFGLVDHKQPITGYIGTYLVTENCVPHGWTVVKADGKLYLIDTRKHIIFSLDNPPGTTPESKQELKNYYGAMIPVRF